MRLALLAVAVLSCLAAWLPPWPAMAQSRYDALDIAKPETLSLAADPRFEAPDRSTIELWLYVNKQQQNDKTDRLCIVELGTGKGASWRLSVATNADRLIFDGPESFLFIPFQRGGYHHVAIVTAGGLTRAFVDGVAQQGIAEAESLGVHQSTPEGLPLIFGCKDKPAARASVSSFRLWSLALVEEDLEITSKLQGPVSEPADLEKGLLAYSLFTDARKDILFKDRPMLFTPMQGAEGGIPFFYRRPPDQELGSIYHSNSGFFIANFAVEFDRDTRQWTMLDGPGPGDFSLPTILPRHRILADGIVAARYERLLAIMARGTIFNPKKLAELVEVFRRTRLIERRHSMGGDNAVLQGQNEYNENPIRAFAIPLATNMRISRIIGSYGGGGIKALKFDAGRNLASGLVGFGEDRQSAFHLELPPGTRLEGVAGRRQSDGRLMALALAYSTVPDADISQADRLSQGVWVERDDDQPVRDPGDSQEGKEVAAFNGSYANRLVYRLNAENGGNMLTLSKDTGNGPVESHSFVPLVGREWQGVQSRPGEFDKGGDRLFIHDDYIRWASSKDKDGAGIVLVRPKPYAPPDDNKLPWGATFSLEHRPNGVIANFMGYNPANMRARDYQATTGARKQVFAMPEDSSSDYTATDSRLIVPHGLFFSLDAKGSEAADATELNTDIERQSAWTLGLGMNIGIPLVASFSVDGSHQESQKTVDKTEFSMVLNRSIVTRYALVADLARIRLHPDFRARVIELRDRNAANFPLDWDSFFEDFGTHFPYAVTYGGLAWSETTKQSQSSEIENSTDDKLEGKASGILDEVLEVGVNANSEYSQGSKAATGSLREHSTYGTYGGSMSKGGGWSVNRGEELPVLLDLRHLSVLLSPLFFDDPAITNGLRAKMEAAIAKTFDDVAARMAAEQQSWSDNIGDMPSGEAREFFECGGSCFP